MDNLLEAMANFGFPVVVSAYLLLRLETRMEELTLSIKDLIHVLGE